MNHWMRLTVNTTYQHPEGGTASGTAVCMAQGSGGGGQEAGAQGLVTQIPLPKTPEKEK